MKVLFVASGNSFDGVSTIVKAQGDSFNGTEVNLSFYPIQGKGLIGYIKNAFLLKKFLNKNTFDVIHAHYSLSGIVASLAGAKPLVVSLMGSDVKSNYLNKWLIFGFYWLNWKKTVVKTSDMKDNLGFKRIEIIPNGVDIVKFQALDTKECRKKLGWDGLKVNILFAANPERPEKNFKLTKEAVSLLSEKFNIVLHHFKNIPHIEIPIYLNASDVVILSSLWEGSPNVVKESMACNRPMVTTRVGDVEWLFGNTDGHYIAGFNPQEFANKIEEAIIFNNLHFKTKGRERILELELGSNSVSNKLINLYKKLK
ncbi:MAG: glycosyltransferase [Bacteroidetes bacterium]|nr:glycosyltransferase [Bacteroidota bacterium]